MKVPPQVVLVARTTRCPPNPECDLSQVGAVLDFQHFRYVCAARRLFALVVSARHRASDPCGQPPPGLRAFPGDAFPRQLLRVQSGNAPKNTLRPRALPQRPDLWLGLSGRLRHVLTQIPAKGLVVRGPFDHSTPRHEPELGQNPLKTHLPSTQQPRSL